VRVAFTKRAIGQIDAITGRIAEQSQQGAGRVRERMQAATALLGRHPYLGQATDLDDVRCMIVSPFPYLIFHGVTADAVIIQRVRHTSRDPWRCRAEDSPLGIAGSG